MQTPTRHCLGLSPVTTVSRWLARGLLALALPSLALAQEEFYHPELEWHTIETEHFRVHYHTGAERSGRVVAKIAEEVYGPVNSLYDYAPSGKVDFIIKDTDDISNGAAYFYDNKVEIYAPSMDFELRGTHNWLRNVVTHEYTHIVQIQASMKFGRTIPAFYFQWLNYESERRPDVLYGYPNVVVSYPISGFVVPAWFAEGVAQYNRAELRYDFWDTHRDMILRSYALDGTMLSWEEMAVFGKTSLGNESSYNAGFAFVSYIAQRYGEEAIREIARSLSSMTVWTIDAAIDRTVGKSGEKVYEEWRAALKEEYAARSSSVQAALREGEPLEVDRWDRVVDPRVIEQIESMHRPGAHVDEGLARPLAPPCCQANATVGFANLYPVFSPDGRKVAYTSAKGGDYFGLSSLFVYDFDSGKETLVRPGVRTAVSWSPDGSRLYYGKNTRDNPHWSLQFDIYEYNLTEEEERRLTRGRRASMPDVSPDGLTIVAVVNADGTSNLATMPTAGGELSILTTFSDGEQVYNPRWSPGGDRIIFDYSVKDGRDIASIGPDGTELTFLVNGPEDSRTAIFTPDGEAIVYASDHTGIFNLYSLDLQSGDREQITNVLGGAFYPTMNDSGDVIYSLYTSSGYKIYRLERPARLAPDEHPYVPLARVAPAPRAELLAMASGSIPQFDWPSLRSYDDTVLPATEDRPYKSVFSSISVVPFLRIDNYNPTSSGIELFKPGLYLYSNEILDKTGFFAGAAMNTRLERDLFLQFYYRGQIPLLYQIGLEPTASLELYNVTRKTEGLALIGNNELTLQSTLSLLEFDLALLQRAISQFSDVEFRFRHSRYTSILESFTIPESGLLVPSSSDLYFIGNDLGLQLRLDRIIPSRTSEINPTGRRIVLRLGYEFNKLQSTDSLGRLEYELASSGALLPLYTQYNYPRVELQWKEYLPVLFRDHTLSASIRGASILGPPVDDFFDFYAGGLVGMRGYPFYSLGGNELLVAGLAYRFPLIRNIDLRILHLYFDKLYASIYGDIGNAWTGAMPSLTEFRRDAGAELRLESFSFYSYPTRIFLSATYGFDRFTRTFSALGESVTYGGEWQIHFGVLFGFNVE